MSLNRWHAHRIEPAPFDDRRVTVQQRPGRARSWDVCAAGEPTGFVLRARWRWLALWRAEALVSQLRTDTEGLPEDSWDEHDPVWTAAALDRLATMVFEVGDDDTGL